MKITVERAMQILDPTHREHYESIEPVNEACKMGMDALKMLHPWAGDEPKRKLTNAETMLALIADVIEGGTDEDGFPNLEYETLVMLTDYIRCPYPEWVITPRCALEKANKDNPEAYADCDACKAHWLMKQWEA